MNGFLGRYEYQMDGKGRVALPSAFRREAGTDRLVLLQWEDTHLTLFPEAIWAEKQKGLLELRRTGPEASRFVRSLLSRAVEVSPDKQGRILVPGWLREAVGLDESVVLNGNIDRVELWNPEAFGKAKPTDVTDEVSGFAHRILG